MEQLGLTARESEVLLWVTHGKTDAEIAGILGVSTNTVDKHLERIYEKLDVVNRTAAAMRGLTFIRSRQRSVSDVPLLSCHSERNCAPVDEYNF